MFKWISSNPILAGVLGLVLVAAVIAFFSYLSAGDKRQEQQLQNQGAVTERAKTQAEIINAVENDRRPVTPAERNSVCNKYDRNAAANCP